MRPILEHSMRSIQSAFMSKYTIHDDVLPVLEIMSKIKNMKVKQVYIALKLDMRKAYDRLEWKILFLLPQGSKFS